MSLCVLNDSQQQSYIQILAQSKRKDIKVEKNTNNTACLETVVNANSTSANPVMPELLNPTEVDASGFSPQFPTERKLYIFSAEQLNADLQSPSLIGLLDDKRMEWLTFCLDLKKYSSYVNTNSPHYITGDAKVLVSTDAKHYENGYTITIDFSLDESISRVIQARKTIGEFAKNPLRFVGASASEISEWLLPIAAVGKDYAPLSEIHNAKHCISFQRQQYADISADGTIRALYFCLNTSNIAIGINDDKQYSIDQHAGISTYHISDWKNVKHILESSSHVYFNPSKLEELQEQEIARFFSGLSIDYHTLSTIERIRKLAEYRESTPDSLKLLLNTKQDSVYHFLNAVEMIDGFVQLSDYLSSDSLAYQLLIEHAKILPKSNNTNDNNSSLHYESNGEKPTTDNAHNDTGVPDNDKTDQTEKERKSNESSRSIALTKNTEMIVENARRILEL